MTSTDINVSSSVISVFRNEKLCTTNIATKAIIPNQKSEKLIIMK
jgi:hypothetical protein